MRYEFTPDLETKNAIIDSEHKTLFKAVNDLMDKVSTGKGKESVDGAVTFLLDYTKKHFSHEEDLQQKSSYPGMVAHKTWHVKFVKDLTEISNKITGASASPVVVIELTKLVSVLITHIKTEDKKLADHLKTA